MKILAARLLVQPTCSGNRGGFIAICFVRENHQYRVEHDLQVRKGSLTDFQFTISLLIWKYLDEFTYILGLEISGWLET